VSLLILFAFIGKYGEKVLTLMLCVFMLHNIFGNNNYNENKIIIKIILEIIFSWKYKKI